MIDCDLLEVELRSLPGVAGIAIDKLDVSVLVLPDTDVEELSVLVSAVLATHGTERTVRVLGAMTRPATRTQPRRLAVIAASLIVLAVAAAGLTGVVPHSRRDSNTVAEGSSPSSIGTPQTDESWRSSAPSPRQTAPSAVVHEAATTQPPQAATDLRTATSTQPPQAASDLRTAATTRLPLLAAGWTVADTAIGAAPISLTPSVPEVIHPVPTPTVIQPAPTPAVVTSRGAGGGHDGPEGPPVRHQRPEKGPTHTARKFAAATGPGHGHS